MFDRIDFVAMMGHRWDCQVPANRVLPPRLYLREGIRVVLDQPRQNLRKRRFLLEVKKDEDTNTD